MRKITKVSIALLVMISLQASLNAQSVTWKTTKDNPHDIVNFMIAADVLNMDIGFNNLLGGSLWGVGVNGYATFKERLGAESALRLNLLFIGKEDGIHKPMWFEAGGFLNLTDRTKTKQTKIILSQHSYTSGNTKTTYTKYIMVPAQRRLLLGVRGGVIVRTFPYDGSGLKSKVIKGRQDEFINSSGSGIYFGVQSNAIHNIFVNTDSYGMCGNTGMFRMNFDILLLPIWTAKYKGVSYKDSIFTEGTSGFVATAGEKVNYNPLGWRLGFEYRPAETRRKKSEGKAKGMYIKIDIGQRPMEGWYTYMGLGFTIMRKKMALLGYKKPEEEKNTSE